MKTINATGDHQPSSDPYATYRAQYRSVMGRALSAMQRSLLLTGRK